MNESKLPFELMIANRPHSEVMKAAALVSEDELDAAVIELQDEQIVHLAMYTSTACHSVGIQQTLIYGCLLHLFATAVERDDRQELFTNLIEDLGVSRTQASRCRMVWNHFGRTLITEPDLRRFFVAESLKILAEERTPEAAREEALELARQGTRIAMKQAKELQAQHGMGCEAKLDVTPDTSSATGVKRKKSKSGPLTWQFFGSVVRIRLEPKAPSDLASIADVIHDLEAAIEEVRQRGFEVLATDTVAA